jgi:hypothetical protein
MANLTVLESSTSVYKADNIWVQALLEKVTQNSEEALGLYSELILGKFF